MAKVRTASPSTTTRRVGSWQRWKTERRSGTNMEMAQGHKDIQEDGGDEHKKRTSMKKSHGKKCPGSLQVPSFEEPNWAWIKSHLASFSHLAGGIHQV